MNKSYFIILSHAMNPERQSDGDRANPKTPTSSLPTTEGNEENQTTQPFPEYPNSTTATTTTTKPKFRREAGKTLSFVSDSINDHLIIARYGTFATISLMTAYGIAKTPIFHRYKTVADIPARCFASRRRIHGRIVSIVERQQGVGLESKSSGSTRSQGTIYCITCVVLMIV